jgi:hypothetical protein
MRMPTVTAFRLVARVRLMRRLRLIAAHGATVTDVNLERCGRPHQPCINFLETNTETGWYQDPSIRTKKSMNLAS